MPVAMRMVKDDDNQDEGQRGRNAMGLTALATDLEAEQVALDDLVQGLEDDAWNAPTPSPGWTVGDQIGHLAYFDGTAAIAISDPAAFRTSVAELRQAPDLDAFTLGRERGAGERLKLWRENRNQLARAMSLLDESARVPWYGPDMGAKSFVTARLMECWAHGQDIRDALGVMPSASTGLSHIARLGFMTWGWTYINRGLELPTCPVRVELTSPNGDDWDFGPSEADESVKGTAIDFCLVVTQRRTVDETSLVVQGEEARDWMEKAQAFAGPPTTRKGIKGH